MEALSADLSEKVGAQMESQTHGDAILAGRGAPADIPHDPKICRGRIIFKYAQIGNKEVENPTSLTLSRTTP